MNRPGDNYFKGLCLVCFVSAVCYLAASCGFVTVIDQILSCVSYVIH